MSRPHHIALACFSISLAPAHIVAQSIPPLPTTARKPVTDTYHGVAVTEDYRWLENWDDPAVRAWSDSQNAHTRSFLDALPARAAILSRTRELFAGAYARYFTLTRRGERLFALKFQPPKPQPVLVALRSADDPSSEQVVLDPVVFDSTGGTTIDSYFPSPGSKYIAISLSRGGSEDGTLHIFELATGRELGDTIPHFQFPTALGSMAWSGDTAFYYTRYPRAGERPESDIHFYEQLYFHRIGAADSTDTYALGKDFPRIAEIFVSATADGRYFLANVFNGDGGEIEHFVRNPKGQWTQVTRFADQATRATLGGDGFLYLVSLQSAPRGRVLRLPLDNPRLADAVVVAEQDRGAIQDIVVTGGQLYVLGVAGGPSVLRRIDLRSKAQQAVPLTPISSVDEIVPDTADGILYNAQTFIEPPAWYRYDVTTGAARKTALVVNAPVRSSDAEVVRTFATSRDGTKVPLNIIRLKGTKLDGQNPTLLSGYGGYGISLTPWFSATRRLWLDQGGVYVITNLRGGGEYGEEWHRAGNLMKKQNVFDDFLACARWLIDNHYTSPARLAIEGGSNGGLLMGAVLTQHPELFRAVTSYVGVYDMLRVELSPNGAFNTTEYGSVKDPAQFRALYAYSPYHHVVDGTRYPAVYLQTGEHDGRVDPLNSRKMAARLQRASSSGQPVLLWTTGAGHGFGTPFEARLAGIADSYAFLFDQLGVTYRPVARPPVP
jgi:prolyl oligopeptidase